jgi:hypothetical protein
MNEPQIKPNKFTGNWSNELVSTRTLPVLDLKKIRRVFFLLQRCRKTPASFYKAIPFNKLEYSLRLFLN